MAKPPSISSALDGAELHVYHISAADFDPRQWRENATGRLIIHRDGCPGLSGYSGNFRHPTEKPVMAMVPPILAFSRSGDIVLDPFLSSGTTAVASRILGRRYIGIEIDPKYTRLAEERLKSEGKK